jgi:hypothetical protein
LEKGLKNCAYCDDYVCEKLTMFFEMAPEAKTTLAEIKKIFRLKIIKTSFLKSYHISS